MSIGLSRPGYQRLSRRQLRSQAYELSKREPSIRMRGLSKGFEWIGPRWGNPKDAVASTIQAPIVTVKIQNCK